MRAFNVKNKPKHTTIVKYKKRSILGSLFKVQQPFFCYAKAQGKSEINVHHKFKWARKEVRYLSHHFWFVPTEHKKRCKKILRIRKRLVEGKKNEI